MIKATSSSQHLRHGMRLHAMRLLAGAALVLCAACTSTTLRKNSAQGTSDVASRTRTETASVTTAPQPASCLGSQLTASLGEHGPALGTEGVVILLHNGGSTACWLTGVPTLQGVDRRGRASRLAFRAATNPAQAIQPPGTGSALLKIHHYGAVLLTECLADECPKPATHYVTLRIGLPGNQSVSMRYPSVLRLGSPGTETQAQPVPAPTGILGH
jgi:hypothetical protein